MRNDEAAICRSPTPLAKKTKTNWPAMYRSSGRARYEELTRLARVSAAQSCLAKSPDVAEKLWRLAQDYQHRAAALDGGRLPDIGRLTCPVSSDQD